MARDGLHLVVTGAPDYPDEEFLFRVLDTIYTRKPIQCIIELCNYPETDQWGEPRIGADYLARWWYLSRQNASHTLSWHRATDCPYRTAAERITHWKPDGVVSFGRSEESDELAKAAIEAGVKVWRPVK